MLVLGLPAGFFRFPPFFVGYAYFRRCFLECIYNLLARAFPRQLYRDCKHHVLLVLGSVRGSKDNNTKMTKCQLIMCQHFLKRKARLAAQLELICGAVAPVETLAQQARRIPEVSVGAQRVQASFLPFFGDCSRGSSPKFCFCFGWQNLPIRRVIVRSETFPNSTWKFLNEQVVTQNNVKTM